LGSSEIKKCRLAVVLEQESMTAEEGLKSAGDEAAVAMAPDAACLIILQAASACRLMPI